MINISEIVDIVSRNVGDGTKVRAVRCDKGNGVIKESIGLKPVDSKVEAVIYLDFATDDMSSSYIAARVLKAFHDGLREDFDRIPSVEFIRDYEQAKERLYIRLSSCPSDSLVKAVAFCDLYMTAYIKLADRCDEGIISVTKDIISAWGIDEETLFRDALANARKKERILSKSLIETIFEACPFPGMMPGEDALLSSIMVLTNEERINGASAIMLCSDLPDEFYLIPSSRHEVMVVPADLLDDASALVGLVHFVNSTEVEQEDILSDNVYHYVNGGFSVVDGAQEALA